MSAPAAGFKGYFCARFDKPFKSWGTANNGTLHDGETSGNGAMLSGYVTFDMQAGETVNVRVGVSFISVEQARSNLENEIPDGVSLEETAKKTRVEWAEKLDRIAVEGASEEQLQTFYTGFFHTLQVKAFVSHRSNHTVFDEYCVSILTNKAKAGSITPATMKQFTKVTPTLDTLIGCVKHYPPVCPFLTQQKDTYRAEWAWLILFAPERLPGMVNSMLQDYKEV